MAKAKGPSQDSRQGMDYYEYRRQHDLVRMRQRAVELDGDVERPAPAEAKPAEPRPAEPKPILGKLFSGFRRPAGPEETETAGEHVVHLGGEASGGEVDELAPDQPEEEQAAPRGPLSWFRRGEPEIEADAPTDLTEQPEDEARAAEPEQPESIEEPEAGDLPEADLERPEADDSDDGADDGADEIEVNNPFAGTVDKLKLFGAGLKQRAAELREKMAKQAEPDDGDDEDGQRGAPAQDEREAAAVKPSLTMALSADEDGFGSHRRRQKSAEEPDAQGNDIDDPLGVMRPADEDTHRAFMRPGTAEISGEAAGSAGEEYDMTDNGTHARPELTEKLAEELNQVPALSRRERKAMANAGTLTRAATKPPESEPVAEDERDVEQRQAAPAPLSAPKARARVDEPTQQFKPLRARPVAQSVAVVDNEDDDDDVEEDDEDDIRPVKRARFGTKRKVYRDEELDDYDDDEDDYDDEDYDEDDYDEEDYEDFDEDEAYDRVYHVSFGRRVLGFLKGILIVVLVFALALIVVRQLEASGVWSLDIVRSTVGQMIPLDGILPAPVKDMDASEETAEPTAAPTEIPTVEPTVQPTPEATMEAVDPGAEGSPLDEDDLGDELTSADTYLA